MNDFTKGELVDLHCSLYGGMHDDHPVPDHLIVLQDKIKTMIDNYCEHENDERFCMMPLLGNPKMCTKCHEFYI